MGRVKSREIILPQPFTVVTDYGDDGETPDGFFDSIETPDGHEWTVLQWDGSTSYVNVNGTTYPLSEVE
jgi:hypothetical protein